MSKSHYDTFIRHLDEEDKEAAVRYAWNLLDKGDLSVEKLYLDFIKPSLNNFSCTHEDKDICIWKEHRRTSIIRTILEISYFFVMKRRQNIPKAGQSVLVVCPEEEYHEIGAIIATHFFTLNGYDASYIGANTPKEQITKAVQTFKPDLLALSVTNYYNLVTTKKTINALKDAYPKLKIVIGGSAFHSLNARNQLDHDFYIDDLNKIKTILGGSQR